MLAAATTFAVLLTMVNLLLLFGVIKRLRVHTALLSSGPDNRSVPGVMLAAGESPAEFQVSTVDGQALTRQDVAGKLVGFFTPSCPACVERVPEFISYAQKLAPGDAVAVLVGEPDELTQLIDRLSPVAQLVIQPLRGPIVQAFSVEGFPALSLVDVSGVVTFSSTDFRGFPAPAGSLAGVRG